MAGVVEEANELQHALASVAMEAKDIWTAMDMKGVS